MIINSNYIVSKSYYSNYNFGTIFGKLVTSYVLGDGVTSIGERAFSFCSGLTSITIPEGVTSIGDYAFEGCSGLTSITIPEGVTSIGSSAFFYCSGLTSITIPESVTSIGISAFNDCSGLTSITIPESVTRIEQDAFWGCSSLTSITIPESVTSIGSGAFYGCSGLTSITIPEGVTSIGEDAFSGCSGLTSITIPEGVTSIEKYTFRNCTGLTSITIPEGVTSIGEDAFYGCSGLTSITIPEGVTSIGEDAFYGTPWYNNQPDGLIYAGKIAYKYKGTMPENTHIELTEGTRGIGNYAFYGCRGLTSVTIPESVTSIGVDAFSGCRGLTSITIPESVISIGERAFNGCSGLTSITIPEGVTNIEDGAFLNCSGLTSVIVADGNTVYDSRNNCNAIIETSSNTIIAGCQNTFIPESVTGIGDGAFYYCPGLTSITIPEGVTSIGDNAFFVCTGLTSITIPESVTSIGKYAFCGCSGLTSITIPEGVTSIGEYAFSSCSELKTISIGSRITSIGTMAFAECKKIEDVYCYAIRYPETATDAFDDSYPEKITLHVPEESVEQYKAVAPWSSFKDVVAIVVEPDKYVLKYVVDGAEYKSSEVEFGTTITPEAEPTKEGYTFSGWSEVPETMPANDVTVTGSFTINSYALKYVVDGTEYKASEVEFGATITPEAEPTKEGYTFSGWSEIPETMPAEDVTVTGSFTINKYIIRYYVGNEVYAEDEVEYGADVQLRDYTPEDATRYSFVGWEGETYETMPAHDIEYHANIVDGVKGQVTNLQGVVAIYDASGRKLDRLRQGVNILLMSDGSKRTVVVK